MSEDDRSLVPLPPEGRGEFLVYQTEDGRTRVACRFAEGTVWLTQAAMAELFQTTPQNITLHIAAIYEDQELQEEATCEEHLQVRQEGSRQVRRRLKYYTLPMILAVGYRIRSSRGTLFRQWATAHKVLEIYSTSIDYDPRAEASQQFFAVVQNKMHWAAHGHTAAEVISRRADATEPNMGMTAWTGSRPRRTDAGVAKNYLNREEIESLNLIVSAYLDFAGLQARNRKPMSMRQWIAKLDDFLRLSDRELLTHAGAVSHNTALAKAQAEYDKFKKWEDAKPRPVDVHFEEAIEQAKKLAAKTKRKPKGGGE